PAFGAGARCLPGGAVGGWRRPGLSPRGISPCAPVRPHGAACLADGGRTSIDADRRTGPAAPVWASVALGAPRGSAPSPIATCAVAPTVPHAPGGLLARPRGRPDRMA